MTVVRSPRWRAILMVLLAFGALAGAIALLGVAEALLLPVWLGLTLALVARRGPRTAGACA